MALVGLVFFQCSKIFYYSSNNYFFVAKMKADSRDYGAEAQCVVLTFSKRNSHFAVGVKCHKCYTQTTE